MTDPCLALTHIPSFIGHLLFSESGDLLRDPDRVVSVFTSYLYVYLSSCIYKETGLEGNTSDLISSLTCSYVLDIAS